MKHKAVYTLFDRGIISIEREMREFIETLPAQYEGSALEIEDMFAEQAYQFFVGGFEARMWLVHHGVDPLEAINYIADWYDSKQYTADLYPIGYEKIANELFVIVGENIIQNEYQD
tara:strand:+ start:4075 stop:4422 length:348 start_codon:yes stop_codon:yes gene_type:complete